MIEVRVLASGSRGNCYWVTDGSTPLLLECGIGWKEIQKGLNFQTSQIAAVLLSHEHGDHAKSVTDAIKAGLDVYASGGTLEALGIVSHRLKAVKAREQLKVGTWTILPFETEHDAVEPLGYLIVNNAEDKLLYATDTYYIRYRFRGLTHIMVECNYSIDILRDNVVNGTVPVELKNRLLRSHFGLHNVKGFLRANDLSKVQEIWLLHLSDGNSDADRFKKEIQELTGKMVFIA